MADVPRLRVMYPEWYHGHRKEPPFFEGWYFKLVNVGTKHRYAIIPGIFLSDDPNRHHAFVQVLDGITGSVVYHRYPAEAFVAARDAFDIQIGPNRFSGDAIELDLDAEGQRISGRVEFIGVRPWPVTLTSPGIMGWYGWVPFMECYHGVLGLDHALRGQFQIDGQRIDWTGGRGYIEKDWGSAFPEAWVWMQSNHFSAPGSSLTASVAIIPWLGSSFRGMIVGLWHEGRLYRFATYTGAKIEHLEIEDGRVLWVICDRRYRLEIKATRARGGLLAGPSKVDMGVRVAETLQGTIQVRLSKRESNSRPLFEDTGGCAGLEIVGQVERLRS